MKKKLCKYLVALFYLLIVYPLSAGDTLKIESSVSADIVSRYVWRGQLLGAYPAIQPNLDFTLGRFSIGSWASYSLSPNSSQEVDLYATFATEYISFTLFDYYYLVDFIEFSNDYFNWGKDSTTHLLEFAATLSGGDYLPLSFTASTFLYGDDFTDSTKSKNYYSTYFELAYYRTIGENEFSAFIGVTPFEGYYSDKFNVVNMGISLSREIEITNKIRIPVNGSLILDPSKKNIFLVFGVSL